jgi:hypothetical protein
MNIPHFSLLFLLAAAMPAAGAQDKPCHDPCVPEAARKAPRTSSPAGAALREQAVLKLKQRFDDADADRNGSLTMAEARDGGFGYVARHFEQIDSQRRGKVSFDDVRRYLSNQKPN